MVDGVAEVGFVSVGCSRQSSVGPARNRRDKWSFCVGQVVVGNACLVPAPSFAVARGEGIVGSGTVCVGVGAVGRWGCPCNGGDL